jgi:hypothetical protein
MHVANSFANQLANPLLEDHFSENATCLHEVHRNMNGGPEFQERKLW